MENNYKTEILSINLNDIDEDYLAEVKEKLKKAEKKLKEKNKPKTITISGRSHEVIKKHCNLFNYNIGEWTEKVLLEEIQKNNCIIKDERDHKEIEDEEISKLENKYIREWSRSKKLMKSNKLLLSKDLKFSGYSILDGLPIYEILIDSQKFMIKNKEIIDDNNVKIEISNNKEISKGILNNDKIEDFLILDYNI
jgi:hypothetical protein